jgi:anti-sigma factor ChrR (cupin superfamily)
MIAKELPVDGFHTFDIKAIPWRQSPFAKGVEVKDLGSSGGRTMQLVRFPPGTAFPVHTHGGPEFIYLLEGSLIQEGKQLGVGWSGMADTGTVDSNFHSPEGCLFLTVYST